MPRQTRCIDCNAEGKRTPRAALKPGPRCETHWRARCCTVGGCRRPIRARGWCEMHWRRWKRRGLYWYSRYPEFYMPMCRKCHNRRDGAAHAKELAEYRRWKHSQNQAAS